MSISEKSEKTWTDKQAQVIEADHHHILVSAGAGSGKTAVLVERIINRVKNPQDPLSVDNILVVTFTEKAASEMRERIASELKTALENQPENEYLQRQLYLLNKAKISTLHSVCLDLLRHYFYYLDLEPGFSVASEYDAELLRQSVMEELIEQEYQRGETEFYQLVDAYGGDKHDEKLVRMILTLHRFARSHPQPDEWLEKVKSYFQITRDDLLTETVYFHGIKRDLIISLTNCKHSLEQAKEICESPGGPHTYGEMIEHELSEINRLLNVVEELSPGNDWDGLLQQFSSLEFAKLPRIASDDDVDEDLKEQGKELRNQAKKNFSQVVNNYFNRCERELMADIEQAAPVMGKLIDTVIALEDKYRQAKNLRGIADFSDLEHYVYRLLTDYPEITQELWQSFQEVMVDEYQDINEVQNAILQALTGDDSHQPDLFMVGDVKQSIYRFRLAEPELFLSRYNTYKAHSNQGELIELQDNFRSSPFVIDSVNDLFKAIMTEELTGLNYDETVELLSGGPGRDMYKTGEQGGQQDNQEENEDNQDNQENNDMINGVTETFLLENEHTGKGESDSERELKLIAETIINHVEKGHKIYDDDYKDYRQVEYSDFVILGRKTKEQAEQAVDIFTEYGIPLYAELDTGYFAAQEVQIMLSLLKIIDNPRQDIPLAGVLRSPVVGLDSNDLMEIRFFNTRGDFYDAVLKAAEESDNDGLREMLTEFLSQLQMWRTISREKNLAELIWQIYQSTGLLDYVAGIPGGRERQANLWSFYERALNFDSFTHSGLVKFLNFIEKLIEQDYDLGKARTVNESDNVVRMMSIHKSKGLEFPVVFIMGLGSNFNFNDQRGDLLLHKDLGLGPKVVDLENRIKYPTVAHHAIKGILHRETLAEEMRILYVAMTRAEEKLYLVGSGKKITENIGRYQNPATSQCYLDWILPNLNDDNRINYRVFEEVGEDESSAKIVNWKDYLRDLSESNCNEDENYLAKTHDLIADLEHAMEFNYPYSAATNLVGKLSVTELSKLEASEIEDGESLLAQGEGTSRVEEISQRPEFMKQSTKMTGAEVGTSIHLAFQHIPVCPELDEDMIANQLDRLVERRLLTSEQREMIWEKSICQFFESNLGQKICHYSHGLSRELPFTIGIPAEEIYEDIAETNWKIRGEKIVVQGVIDYLFWDGKDYYLIDFKTDKIKHGEGQNNFDNLKSKYKKQIELYLRAIWEIEHVKPKYAYIYHVPSAIWLDMMDM